MKQLHLWLCSALLLTVACGQKPSVLATPSGEQADYAERYPARLTSSRERFASDETAAGVLIGEFKGYPAALREPRFDSVKAVYQRAEAEGRSSAYADASLEGETVARFFEEEKDPLRQKVAGSVAYSAKQKDCSEDLGGAAVAAMERGVDKQLEERLRSRSDAHRYAEDHVDELGKPNLETLNKQADAIARSSYLVFVRLELHRRELEALLDDTSRVGSTLERTTRESDAILADSTASKARKALAERRRKAALDARARLDGEVEQARRALAEMEQRVSAAQKYFTAAYDSLIDDVEARASVAAH